MTMIAKPTTAAGRRSTAACGRRLQQDMAAVRVSFTWLGVRNPMSSGGNS